MTAFHATQPVAWSQLDPVDAVCIAFDVVDHELEPEFWLLLDLVLVYVGLAFDEAAGAVSLSL